MNYISTRSNKHIFPGKNAAQAIIKGIAEDRGLFVPDKLPILKEEPDQLVNKNYQDISKMVISEFLPDYSDEELFECVNKAYDCKFEAEEVVPLVPAGDAFFLELFHGRTAAFKDMALSILPHLLTTAIDKVKEDKKIAILTATSGDTGKAALEGFADVEGTDIIVFYPHIGVSQVQERQMTTQEGNNVHVFGIKGNFDDAQSAVKKIFSNSKMAEELDVKGYRFSSANSINIGRLVPQVAYYVWAYIQMIKKQKVKSGEPMNVVVPTGNFGNILAAYYAREMGIPIKKLICASNRNKVLTDFINTGIYDTRREFYVTSSPSMDILVSSNLERLLYHLSGENGKQISRLMQQLDENKHYQADEKIMEGLKSFYAGYATEEETLATIKNMYGNNDYLMDPHTSVAYKVYQDYRQGSGDETPTIIAATASAYKFADTVLKALGLPEEKDGFASIKSLYKLTGVKIPSGLEHLEHKEIKHQKILEKDAIESTVIETLVQS